MTRKQRTRHLIWQNGKLSPFRRGGLGIKDLRAQNTSLQHKWLWRFNSEEAPLGDLWTKVTVTKYGLLNPSIMKQPQFLIHVLLETYEHTLGLFPNQDLSSFGRWQENEILARYLARPVTPKGSVPNFIQCGTKLIMTRHNIND